MAEFEFDDTAIVRDDIDAVDDEDVLLDPTTDTDVRGGTSLQQELLQTSVNDYYNALAEQGLTPTGRDPTKFELVGGRLRLKAYPNIDLVALRTGKPRSFATICNQRSGGTAIREELGFPDWTRDRRKMSTQAVATLQEASRGLGKAAAAVDTVELRDLGQAASEASDTVRRMETTLNDTEINEILMTIDDPPLNLRELRGLDRALQTIRGELTNNLAKLSELDGYIAAEQRKLDEADSGGVDEPIKRRIAQRLRDLQDERASRLEAAAANRQALRSQINRVRETINSLLHEDSTLADRIRTLFREQGITIASILTAIGMAISTLVLALTGSGGAAPSPTPPPSDKGGLREWVKKHLRSLGRALARLAGKAAVALPGIIGSIVSWLLTLLAKTAGWLAENLWAVVVTVGGLLLVAAREWLSKKP